MVRGGHLDFYRNDEDNDFTCVSRQSTGYLIFGMGGSSEGWSERRWVGWRKR